MVYTPNTGETVDATRESHIYQVGNNIITKLLFHIQLSHPLLIISVKDTKCFFMLQIILRDSLVSALQFSQTRDAEIAWVDGQLVKEHLKSLAQREEKMDVDTFDSVPVLEQLPLTEV